MSSLFHETFDTETDGLPGGWTVEQNSDLKNVPGIRRGDQTLEFLSAGNKFLPVIPEIGDCRIRFTFSILFSKVRHFGIILSFRYDPQSGRGQALRISRSQDRADTLLEYGLMQRNRFIPQAQKSCMIADDLLDQPAAVEIQLHGTQLKVSLAGAAAAFTVRPGKGMIALSREHFFDILKILSFDIDCQEKLLPASEKSFTVPLPEGPTLYPIFCDVTLRDYRNCLEAGLVLRGGTAELDPGEGNYHGMQTDILTRPFLKVVTPEKTFRHTIYDGDIVNTPIGMAPEYFYRLLFKKADWPLRRTVRFMKPDRPFNLAAGFEKYYFSSSPNAVQEPSETLFSTGGEILYSGKGITGGEYLLEFLSQEDKQMLGRLPQDDPRLEQAQKFVRNNHYFLETEIPQFKICLKSTSPLPARYEIILEDALLRPVRKLRCRRRSSGEFRAGVRSCPQLELTVEPLEGLAPGIWHLRFRSLDQSVPPLEDYCAFEIMSTAKDALPPPLLSGLPFLYDARTETRSLETDAFDPWHGSSADSGHYIACTVFLPPAARKYRMIPTIHAYQRKYFLWLSSRCADHWSIRANQDLISQADFVNIADELNQASFLWGYAYKGQRLKDFIDFAERTGDPGFNLEKLRELAAAGKSVDMDSFKHMAENYWEEWLDDANRNMAELTRRTLKKIRRNNPGLKTAQYGPFHIYAGHLKGMEAPRLLGNENSTPEDSGFWQYEDYPYACGYGLERGVYCLTGCLMAMPESRIYPEIYTLGGLKIAKQGCPDGAVFFAHPPFGQRKMGPANRMIRRIYEYAFASGYLTPEGFNFWRHYGFQACAFTRPWYEATLKGWRTVHDYPPERPLRSAAFLSSSASRRASHRDRVLLSTFGSILDVRNTAAEDVPWMYEMMRRNSLCAGFQLTEECLSRLNAADTDILVLPPLKGMSARALQEIRRLHGRGVHLIAFEDVSGLEDLFGVRRMTAPRTVTRISGTENFCPDGLEICDDDRCRGYYEAGNTRVLLQAEIPVLTIRNNGGAQAAFFNVPPMLVKEDRLHDRLGYSKDGISILMERAAAELARSLSGAPVETDCGHLIAYQARNGARVVIVSNHDERKDISPVITIRREAGCEKLKTADRTFTLLSASGGMKKYRALLPPGESIVLIFE